jgi:hypothetical protein
MIPMIHVPWGGYAEEYAYWHHDEFGTVVARECLDGPATSVVSVQFVPDKSGRDKSIAPPAKLKSRELEFA